MGLDMHDLELTIKDEAGMQNFAIILAKAISPGTKIYFSGQLGAGKTTLIRFLLKHLGVNENIKSPTYTLIETYQIGNQFYYHFDFYRIQSPEELRLIGIEEYLTGPAICFVEWPEQAKDVLPQPDISFKITMLETGRRLMIFAKTERGQAIINKISQEINYA